VYGHVAKKVIPNEDLIDALLIVIKRTGCYHVGYNRWELMPKNQRMNWINAKFWMKKEYLQVKPPISAAQAGYGMKAAEEAADNAQYNESGAQLASGYAAAQGSITNLPATNYAQQQHIVALPLQVSQRANNAG
jgi:hypothetical protein